jgi:hypothetical protein
MVVALAQHGQVAGRHTAFLHREGW